MHRATWLLVISVLPALARGQASDPVADPDKVSNDQPGRPIQMAPASTEVKEAFDDFDRFRRRKAWERAFKSLDAIPQEQAFRFVDGEAGFIIPVPRKRRDLLGALPAEGRSAYRLLYDADARKLYDDAQGAAELPNLERLYSSYFVSAVGDNAADRLGDAYFEQGRFDRAADCWLAVLRDRPDTDLAPALLATKAALALSRAGRRSEFDQIRADLAGKYRDESVTLGSQSGKPAELLRRLLGEEPATVSVSTAAEVGPVLGGEAVPADWTVRLSDTVEAGMTPAELAQWRSNLLSAAVPAATVAGPRLLVNYLGFVLAFDLATGKMLWRSSSFHDLDVPAMQGQAQMLDKSRFAVAASADHVWDVSRDLKDPNYNASFRLTCRRASGGELLWRSSDLPDYAGIEPYGAPLLAGGRLYLAARGPGDPQQGGMPQQMVLAIQPGDGKLLWKTAVGTLKQGNDYYYYYAPPAEPTPRLLLDAGTLYLDTHAGVLARLDAETGALDWGFGYPTEAAGMGMNRFMIFDEMPSAGGESAGGTPQRSGAAMLIKGAKSDRLKAIDPDRMTALWDRPLGKASRLLAVLGRLAIIGGPELGAIDLDSRKLLWATRLPDGSANQAVLVRPGGIWQLTPRGIFEVDPANGDVRRIFRGDDLGSAGGDLLLTDSRLLAVSNRAICAYPRGGPAPAATPAPAPASAPRASHD